MAVQAGGTPAYRRGVHAPHLCLPYKTPKPERRTAPNVEEGIRVRVYCDLDGVLADFNRGCLELFPEGGPIAEKIPTHTVTKLTWHEEGEMWRRVESKPDFFLSLPWMSDGEELWRWLDSNVVPAPAILTGLPMGRAGQLASKQKQQWCRDRLGEHVTVFCCGTRNKHKFGGPGCVLIDDRGDLREAWEAHGGIFVHHTSAADSIGQLQKCLRSLLEKSDSPRIEPPLHLSSICWAAQTPAGCFRPNCRYMHVPISRWHRSWIQLWCFVMWNQRMFHDLDSLVSCAREVYGSSSDGRSSSSQWMSRYREHLDNQACETMLRIFETLRDSSDLGFPFDFLRGPEPPSWTTGGLAAPASVVKSLLADLRAVVAGCEALSGFIVVVVGSMGLGLDVDGSDVDLVLCGPLECDMLCTLRALETALAAANVGSDRQLVVSAAAPVVTFVSHGLSVDVAINQMGAIRDMLLFRYALRGSSSDLRRVLWLVKHWLKRRHIPARKQGGVAALAWTRLVVRFHQEHRGEAPGAPREASEWLRLLFARLLEGGLPVGGSNLAMDGEQAESGANGFFTDVTAATLLMLMHEVRLALRWLSGDAKLLPTSEQEPIVVAGRGDSGVVAFPAMDAHVPLCCIGHWNDPTDLALFYACLTEESKPEVLLCRVLRVFGGPAGELRKCRCAACANICGEEVQFVSRRSRDWLILVTLEEVPPGWSFSETKTSATVTTSTTLEGTQGALQAVGITKKRPQEEVTSDASAGVSSARELSQLVLRPVHLVERLGSGVDPLKRLAELRSFASRLHWLPAAESVAPRFCRNALLGMRNPRLAASSDCTASWSVLSEAAVFSRLPWRQAAEEARAHDELLSRLRGVQSVRGLRRAIRDARKAFPETDAVSQESLSEAEKRLEALLGAKLGAKLSTGTSVPASSYESAGGSASVRDASVSPSEAADTGSDAECGVIGADVDKLVTPTCAVAVSYESAGDSASVPDASALSSEMPGTVSDVEGSVSASVAGDLGKSLLANAVPKCRCGVRCKCGLQDALGLVQEVWRGPPSAALRVGGLRPDADEESLYRFFVKVAPVATVRVVRDTRTWNSECHGFVNFWTFQDAELALHTLDNACLEGRRCRLSWSSRARRSNQATTTTDDGELRGQADQTNEHFREELEWSPEADWRPWPGQDAWWAGQDAWWNDSSAQWSSWSNASGWHAAWSPAAGDHARNSELSVRVLRRSDAGSATHGEAEDEPRRGRGRGRWI